MSQDSNYIYLNELDFKKEILEEHAHVIVEFGANWCGGCHVMASIVNDISIKYQKDVRIVKLDKDRNKYLVGKYGVIDIPTFLFIKNGEVVHQIIGAVSRRDFEDKLITLISNN